jgi:catalase
MVASLRNVDEDLASRVADGLGIELPEPLPRVLENPAAPEITQSPALSLASIPGETGVRGRRVAILVADGVAGEALAPIHAALTDAGAVPRYVAPRLGTVATQSGDEIEADASMEVAPDVLFDGIVLPDGAAAVAELAADPHTMEFVSNQFRHCKTMLVLGAARTLLEKSGVPAKAAPGVLIASESSAAAQRFIGELSKHRHYGRERQDTGV